MEIGTTRPFGGKSDMGMSFRGSRPNERPSSIVASGSGRHRNRKPFEPMQPPTNKATRLWTVFLPGGLEIWRTPNQLRQRHNSWGQRTHREFRSPGSAPEDFKWAMSIQNHPIPLPEIKHEPFRIH